MEPDDFAGRDGLQELDRICRELAQREAPDGLNTLRQLLLQPAKRTYEKHDVPSVVAAALASRGTAGIGELRNLINEAPGVIYPMAILEILWSVSQGVVAPRSRNGVDYPPYDLPSQETRISARMAFDDFIIESQNNANLFEIVVNVMHELTIVHRDIHPLTRDVMRVFRDSSILLTQTLVDEFRDLIRSNRPEAEYQHFLESHPVFLDPLAAEVFPQARLGLELITDFVLRRHDNRYIAVEIEKPQDPIFTQRNDFTSNFSHAVGQVIDFQGWVAENVAYAQRTLPMIENPAGLLIIGRQSSLDDLKRAKLRRWCSNSRFIEIVTFDDLADRADMLLRSLRRASPEHGIKPSKPISTESETDQR